ncbi:MAG TPA: C10 family peptidase [Acidobacteriota bacterium]|nr:C10 family peptidase [Acidobacteriota bacterium]
MLSDFKAVFRGLIVVVSAAVFSVCLIPAPAVKAELATVAEMEQVCQNWLTQMVLEKGVWAGETNPGIVGVNEITSGDTLLARYYSISPRGFVVVPVLKEMLPVKAYSDESDLDEKQEGGFLLLLREMLSDRLAIYADRFGSLEAPQPATGDALFGREQRSRWDVLTLPAEEYRAQITTARMQPAAEAGPLLTSKWHQSDPYWDYCPMGDGGRCVVGCVATAAAQIMQFWKWPAIGVGSYSYYWEGDFSCNGSTPGQELSADFSDSYGWANIPDSCGTGCSPTQEAALAELNYEVGVAFNMNYGHCGSGASVSRGLIAYPTYFKYSADISQEFRAGYDLAGWFGLIQEEIDAGRPAQYVISRHSIVCDGYRDQYGQYEYHMNYGWGGSFNTWFVLDSLYCSWEPESLCPAEIEWMLTHIVPQIDPVLELVGYTLNDASGDGDGHADPDEVPRLTVTVRNRGWDAYYVAGKLSTDDPYITFGVDSLGIADAIVWGDSATAPTEYYVGILPGCPDPHVAVLEMELTAIGGYVGTDTLYLFIGDTPGFEDDLESGPGYWEHWPVIPTYVDEWHLDSYRSHSATTSFKAGAMGAVEYTNNADGGLITPPFLLPQNPVLDFWHWIDAEIGDETTAWDGSIVMISSGDGQWTQVDPVGGYPYTIIDNPASPFEPGTPCFSGTHDWSQVQFDLAAYSGVVQLMFRFGSDGAAVEEGWYIDDVQVTGSCCGGLTGNIDCDPEEIVDIGDLTELIRYLFIPPTPTLCCEEEANIDGDPAGLVDIGDLTGLIAYLFISPNPDPAPCP